jgi:hypothetical protein
MKNITKLPKNTNTPAITASVNRPKNNLGVAHVVNLGEGTTDAMRLARHLKRRLPDWARRRK